MECSRIAARLASESSVITRDCGTELRPEHTGARKVTSFPTAAAKRYFTTLSLETNFLFAFNLRQACQHVSRLHGDRRFDLEMTSRRCGESQTSRPNKRSFKKDIGLLSEGNNRDDDRLSLDVFQVGLRQHSHTLTATVLGEDERIAAETHRPRLESVPVYANGLLDALA